MHVLSTHAFKYLQKECDAHMLDKSLKFEEIYLMTRLEKTLIFSSFDEVGKMKL